VKRGLNLWLLILTGVFLASWFFGRHLDDPAGADPSVDDVVRESPVTPDISGEDEANPLVHLRVLNGTPQGGLARDFCLLLGRAGCVAESVDNAPHDRFEESLLVNRRLGEDEAKKLARRLGDIPVLREWDDRTSEDAVLVLGLDHSRVRGGLEKAAAEVK